MDLKRAIIGPILSCIFLLFFIYVLAGVQWVFNNFSQDQNKEELLGSISVGVQNNVTENIISQPVVEEYLKLEVDAKAAISVESNLEGEIKVLFEKESSTIMPIASLTKLMTAVIVLENYNLSDTWQVGEKADQQDPMKQDIKLDDTISVESLLEIMLVGSSNKAAYALSEIVGEQNFVGLMNQKAKSLGLKNTFFFDPTGLSPKDVSTASDLAKFAEYILSNYPKIAHISKVKEFYVPGFGNVTNTDQLLGEMPDIVFGKTGYTAEAKGCLLLAINYPGNNDYLISVILGADDRFAEMKKLIAALEVKTP